MYVYVCVLVFVHVGVSVTCRHDVVHSNILCILYPFVILCACLHAFILEDENPHFGCAHACFALYQHEGMHCNRIEACVAFAQYNSH